MTESRIASPGRRLKAFLLDYLIIASYLAALAAVTSILLSGSFEGAGDWIAVNPFLSDAVAFLTAVLPVILYFAISESSGMQATWGKQRAGIKVVDANGEPLPFGTAVVRSAIKFLPWQMAHTALLHIPGWPLRPQAPPTWTMVLLTLVWVLVALYLGSLWLRRDRRTPYDRLAGTYVITTQGSEPIA